MLVLTRKKGEQVVIGDDIAVTVMDIRGNKVRLGIDAPQDVAIHRAELLQNLAEQESRSRDVSEPSAETGYGQVVDMQNNATSDQFPHTMIHEDRRRNKDRRRYAS